MPGIITEVDEFTTNVEIPVNTDLLDASTDGAFRKGIQALANRTKNLLTKSLRWRSVADITALQAIAAADRADGDVVLVRSTWAVYVFRSGSSSSSAAPWIYLPSAGSGRWHHVLAPHVQTSPERWTIPPENHLPFGAQAVTEDAPTPVAITSSTYAAIGSTLALGPLLAGDLVWLDGSFTLDQDTATSASGFCRLEADGVSIDHARYNYSCGSAPSDGILRERVHLSALYTVASDAPGGIAFGMTANATTLPSGQLLAKGPFCLRGMVIRP